MRGRELTRVSGTERDAGVTNRCLLYAATLYTARGKRRSAARLRPRRVSEPRRRKHGQTNQLGPRACARVVLGIAVLMAAAVDCGRRRAGTEHRRQRGPLRTALAEVRVAPAAPIAAAPRAARSAANPALESPAFFKTRTGILVAGVMAVGCGLRHLLRRTTIAFTRQASSRCDAMKRVMLASEPAAPDHAVWPASRRAQTQTGTVEGKVVDDQGARAAGSDAHAHRRRRGADDRHRRAGCLPVRRRRRREPTR